MIDTGRYALYISLTSSIFGVIRLFIPVQNPSSDLWIAGAVPNTNDTGTSAQVQYAIGSPGGARVFSSFFAEQVTHDFDAFPARFSVLRPRENSRVDDFDFTVPNQAFSALLC